jgi:hypothetical protein
MGSLFKLFIDKFLYNLAYIMCVLIFFFFVCLFALIFHKSLAQIWRSAYWFQKMMESGRVSTLNGCWPLSNASSLFINNYIIIRIMIRDCRNMWRAIHNSDTLQQGDNRHCMRHWSVHTIAIYVTLLLIACSVGYRPAVTCHCYVSYVTYSYNRVS